MGEKKRRRKKNATEYGLVGSYGGYGVQPLGNLLVQSTRRNARDEGLGRLRVLSDEMICDILGLVRAKDLGRLSLVSKVCYVFSHQEALWRNSVLEEFKGDFVFKGRWRDTYIGAIGVRNQPARLKVDNFYSDYLFQSWLCANVEIKGEWLSRDNIERRSKLSVEDFVKNFEEPNKPVLITDAMQGCPALTRWTREYLLEAAGNVKFSVGPVEMKLIDYFAYADSVKEERPLYLFDPNFSEKAPALLSDFEVPVYFREDLFSVLGKERPDYRWLILGPARSGSSFHIDPNSTSAWNAVIKGSKKWILYPPDVVPPGVHPSPDGADVATPVSITEWFMNFYPQAGARRDGSVECVCKAGEVLFVPNGWWHIVINLEDSIAITQNYVSRSNLLNVLEFLSRPNSKELVSGTDDRVNLHDKFKSRYEELFPGSIEQLERKKSEQSRTKKSFWDTVVDSHSGSFKFNFS